MNIPPAHPPDGPRSDADAAAHALEHGPRRRWSDRRLVAACLAGDEDAWAVLIDRYKHLIYSVPFRYHATPDDASDIFQAVCIELFESLGKLRDVDSLRSWLLTVASHQCFHWKRRRVRREHREDSIDAPDALELPAPPEPSVLEELERAQVVRDALAQLSDRCRELIALLFYTDPAVPYREVATRLGLATGSIGFIRGRCLQKLERHLSHAESQGESQAGSRAGAR